MEGVEVDSSLVYEVRPKGWSKVVAENGRFQLLKLQKRILTLFYPVRNAYFLILGKERTIIKRSYLSKE
ncbi:hypothetical protein C5O19_16890 [Siphonobacter curvatus]|uniref:Uncharacterized protein n=1 Tax=Siphonobacter curvatus TaxID=2094562 RepID=A0A2S7IKB2_9BACT|nr:hypothetical protein C5O19_16890 [Siphonobacter curvatus]